MLIDYDVLSRDYDLTRDINVDTLKRILSKADIDENSFVLDFGCGTGNYACAVKKLTGARVFGVDPSEGMIEKARGKGAEIEFKKGCHASVPYDGAFFDLIYMTDVIHHVPDLDLMFAEFFRILKPGGRVCILTESHGQIESRFWSAYFPATVKPEKERYPDIPVIISSAGRNGFTVDENISTDCEQSFTVSPEFVKLVENKGYSMFRLISGGDFENGLKRLKDDCASKTPIRSNHGETLLWLKK